MAKNIFVSPNGSDSNDGTSTLTPVKTWNKAVDLCEPGDAVNLMAGVYPGESVDIYLTDGPVNENALNTVWKPYGDGKVIVNYDNTPIPGTISLYIEGDDSDDDHRAPTFYGITFVNPAASDWIVETRDDNADYPYAPRFVDCVFAQVTGTAQTGSAFESYAACDFENCSFYNLNHAAYSYYFASPNHGIISSCYIKDCAQTPKATTIFDYNAFPGNVDANGLDTDDANTDPGFVDPASYDFRLSRSDSVAYAKFITGGINNTQIGASGTSGIYFDSTLPQTQFIDAVPENIHGGFTNDSSYTDPGGAGYTGNIITSSGELVLDLTSNPSARSGRIYSSVWDIGTDSSSELITVFAGFVEDLPVGSAVDTDTTLPSKKIEYRSSSTIFNSNDVSPSWTTMGIGEDINVTNQYVQIRITLHTDHTNS